MKKKLFALLMMVVMLFSTAAFSACGGAGNGDGGDTDGVIRDYGKTLTAENMPEGGYDGSAVTIRFYHTMGQNLRDVLDAYIPEFNKIYPNITVKHEQVGSYDDVKSQISTEITEGLQPHIAYCYPDHVASYNVAGAVQPLDVLINDANVGLTAEQIADFIPGYYEEGRQFGDGVMYTLPFSKSTEVLYYNKTFFAKNNLLSYVQNEDGSSRVMTWVEMEELCSKIIALDDSCVPLGYDSESNWFITMCEQMKTPYTSATGEKYLFNTPENRAFVKDFCEWYKEGYVTTQEIYGAYTSNLFKEQGDGVDENGNAILNSYMSIGSSAGATHQRPDKVDDVYPFEVGITSIPQYDLNNKKVISQGPSLCLFKKSNFQETLASWLFIKFLTTTVEFQAEFSMASGYVPAIKSVNDNAIYQGFIAKADGGANIAALSAKVCLEQADYYYTSPAFNGSSVAREQVGALVKSCLMNTATISDPSKIDSYILSQFEAVVKYCEQMAPSKK